MKTNNACELDFCAFNRDYRCTLPSPPSLSANEKNECVLVWLTSMFFNRKLHFFKCAATYCIHNRNEVCTLPESPSIDDQGTCDECEFLTLDDEFLESKKKEVLIRRSEQMEPN